MSKPVAIYAQWKPDVVYKVVYHGNGNSSGTTPEDTSSNITGDIAIVKSKSSTLEKTGYFFTGWNTQENGTGKNYVEGNSITIDVSNVELYARWSARADTVYFNSLGGTPVGLQIVPDGGYCSMPAETQKACFAFDGWYKDGECNLLWNFSSDVIKSTCILYEKWVPVINLIVFNKNDTSAVGLMNDQEIGVVRDLS